jgi:hypothetical protein
MDPDEKATCRLAERDAEYGAHATMHGPPPQRITPSQVQDLLRGKPWPPMAEGCLNDVLDIVTAVDVLGQGRIWVVGRPDQPGERR